MPAKLILLPGERFPNTRLTYLHDVDRDKPKVRKAKFSCDCGNFIEVPVAWVRHNNTISCGCYRRGVVTDRNTKHSHAVRNNASGAYRSWQAMHQRAGKVKNYEHVQVCLSWSGEEGFVQFLQDMGERPDGMSIERIDGSKGYEPGNCKWANATEQANNTRSTVKVTIGGETHSINEWCRLKGIGYHLIKQRRKRGMSLEDAILKPIDLSKSNNRKGGDHAT